MIGKLLSNPFRSHDVLSSTKAASPTPTVPVLDSPLSPAVFDDRAYIESSDSFSNKVPISVIQEADTLNLLYGSTSLPVTFAETNPAKDIRIAVIADAPFLDHALFDTQTAVEPGQHSGASANWFSEDIPTFRDLQERVFGSSQIKYNGPTTKLHPFPLASTSSTSYNKWLVSRLFRLKPKSAQRPNPSPSGNPPAAESTARPVKVADYTCAICVFVSPSNSHSCITNFWDELNAALLPLQRTIAARLASVLPLSFRELQRDFQRGGASFGSISLDDEIKLVVDLFRQRFLGAVSVPRVICGQKRWSTLLDELRWAVFHFDAPFVAQLLASFVKYNPQLVTLNIRSAAALGNIRTRTVVVGDRIITRRLIFILSELIHDSYSDSLKDYGAPRQIKLQPAAQYDDDSTDDDSEISLALRSTSINSLCSASVLPVQGSEGWEVSNSHEAPVAESPSICTMSHVIRPSFTARSLSSSSGSSLAAVSRMAAIAQNNSIQNVAASMMRKAATLSSSFSTASFTNSFPWQRHQERANSVASVGSVDDIMFHSPPKLEERLFNDYEYYSESIPPAPRSARLPRSNQGRSSIGIPTLTTNTRSNSVDSRLSSHSSSLALSLMVDQSDGSIQSTSSTYTSAFSTSYESVAIPSKSAVCLDVPAIDEDNDVFDSLGSAEQWNPLHVTPAVVTPVAGYLNKFHPDFVIQGCPPKVDLQERIVKTMKSEGAEGPTLILNSVRGEIQVLECGRTTSSAVTSDEIKKVEQFIESILTDDGNVLERLRHGYESRFDIL